MKEVGKFLIILDFIFFSIQNSLNSLFSAVFPSNRLRDQFYRSQWYRTYFRSRILFQKDRAKYSQKRWKLRNKEKKKERGRNREREIGSDIESEREKKEG